MLLYPVLSDELPLHLVMLQCGLIPWLIDRYPLLQAPDRVLQGLAWNHGSHPPGPRPILIPSFATKLETSLASPSRSYAFTRTDTG